MVVGSAGAVVQSLDTSEGQAAGVEEVAVDGVVVALSSGAEVVLAVDAEGRLHSWWPHAGQGLPLGLTGVRLGRVVASVEQARTPERVGGALAAHRVLAVAAGLYHGVAVLYGGGVATWGENDRGQLGHGPGVGDVSSPRLVETLAEGTVITAASAGSAHTLLLAATGHALSCGWGLCGRLGHGSQEDESAPRVIEALAEHLSLIHISEPTRPY